VITFLNGAISNEIILTGLAAGATGVIDDVTDVEALLGEGGVGFFILADSGGGGDNPTTSTQVIDVGTIGSPVTFNAATGAIAFSDNVQITTEVIIQNFGVDDRILSNADSADTYSFTTPDDEDLVITFTPSPEVSNTIVLDGVLIGKEFGFIGDFATAVDAVGFDFIVFG
jgi:hypothetical protein